MGQSTKQSKFKNIVLHWCASTYAMNPTIKSSYHYIIDQYGNVHEGVFKPEDNLNCNDGNYAPHCGGGNTGRIGIALLGMAGYRKDQPSLYPITRIQLERMYELSAKLCLKYGLKPKDVLTHAEFGKANPKTTSYGKIDICYIPYNNLYGIEQVAEFIRGKVNWYYEKLKKQS